MVQYFTSLVDLYSSGSPLKWCICKVNILLQRAMLLVCNCNFLLVMYLKTSSLPLYKVSLYSAGEESCMLWM
jgi:hypothetical protein